MSDAGDAVDHDRLLPWAAAADRVGHLREVVLARCAVETVALDRVAGRTLAEPFDAPTDVPARSRATMDGFALDAAADYPLEVLDHDVYPEDEPPDVGAGQAVRVATGAALPPSTNAVLEREAATVADGMLRGPETTAGRNVSVRGSNVAAGERLFEAGERLAPRDALLLGDVGVDEVAVREPFSVGLLATGTEIHEGRQRDLDSPMLANLVRAWGHEATHEGSVPDEYGPVETRIAELADRHDVVVTSGGTSVGDRDYVVRALSALGTVLFHGVKLRPGKPVAVARLDDRDAVVIAVPGKPVGAHAVTALVARPLFTGDASLPTLPARMARAVDVDVDGFTAAVPVSLADGVAMPLGHADSALAVYGSSFDPSVLSSSTRATRADGVVLTESDVAAEESVDVVPYRVLE